MCSTASHSAASRISSTFTFNPTIGLHLMWPIPPSSSARLLFCWSFFAIGAILASAKERASHASPVRDDSHAVGRYPGLHVRRAGRNGRPAGIVVRAPLRAASGNRSRARLESGHLYGADRAGHGKGLAPDRRGRVLLAPSERNFHACDSAIRRHILRGTYRRVRGRGALYSFPAHTVFAARRLLFGGTSPWARHRQIGLLRRGMLLRQADVAALGRGVYESSRGGASRHAAEHSAASHATVRVR